MNPKVPKYIKNKMRLLALFSRRAMELSKEIDGWFENQGYNTDPNAENSLRSGSGLTLDELDNGNDISEAFAEAFEKGDFISISPVHSGDIVYYIAYENGLFALKCTVLNVNCSPSIKGNFQLKVCDESARVKSLFGRIYVDVFENIGKRLFFSKDEANRQIASLLSKEV